MMFPPDFLLLISGLFRIGSTLPVPVPLRSGPVVGEGGDVGPGLEPVRAGAGSREVSPAEQQHQDESCRQDEATNHADKNNGQWK